MKQMKKKLSLVLIMALILGIFGNVATASAATTKSSWSVKTKSGIVLEVASKAAKAGTIYMDKNEFQDFNLYKSGKEIKQTDSGYEVTWSSDDEEVIWIDKTNGKARADKFGDMESESGNAVITARIKNRTTKAVTYRRFNVVVGEEEPTPSKAPTATPTPTKAPTATPTPTATPIPEAASITLRFGDKTDPTQTLEPNYSYTLETLVYDTENNLILPENLKLYFKYFSDKDGISFEGNTFKAIKEGEYTITVGAYKTEAEAKAATSANNALLTAELKNLVVQAGGPVIVNIQQMTLRTVKLTLNTADYAKKLAADSNLLKVKCNYQGYTFTMPVNTVTQYTEDPCSVLVTMRSKLTADYEYDFYYDGYENFGAVLIGSDTEPAFITLIGGPVETQDYYPFEVKVYSDTGVDITDVAYYNFRFKALDNNMMNFSYQLSNDRIWFISEGKSAVIEATLDRGYDSKGNKIPDLTSVAQFFSVPKAKPIYIDADKFAHTDKQSLLVPEKLTYTAAPQVICLDDMDQYIAASFPYIDEKKKESTQYIVSGRDTTGSTYTYTYWSADTTTLLVNRTDGGLIPVQTGSTVVYIYRHTELPATERNGEVIAVIPVTVAPKRALTTFELLKQSSVSLSTTGNTSGDESITIELLALDQQKDPVDASYTFSVLDPAGAVFSNLFNYSINDGVLKIWEGAGLNSLVEKDRPKSIIVTITASYDNVQKQKNFQVFVTNTKEATVHASELFITNSRVDLKLDQPNESFYTSEIQVRSVDRNGYFIRLENLKRINSISEASKANGEYSVMITNATDDSNAGKLIVESTEKGLKVKHVNISGDAVGKSDTGVYKVSLYRGNGSDAVPVSIKTLEVVDTSATVSVEQKKFSVLSPDAGFVKGALTFTRGGKDITEFVTLTGMHSVRSDNILVVFELYANINVQEQNDAWREGLHTSVTIPLKNPLQFTIGQ